MFLNVKEMPNVQRDGINLYSNISINFTDAILGTVIRVILLYSIIRWCQNILENFKDHTFHANL